MPCTPSKTFTTESNSGGFGTTGSVLLPDEPGHLRLGLQQLQRPEPASERRGRQLRREALAKYDGYYYFESSAGAFDHASVYWWK